MGDSVASGFLKYAKDFEGYLAECVVTPDQEAS